MTGPTHKQYGICFAYIAAILIYKYGLIEVNYYLALPILMLTAKYGALFPDVDHHWQNVSEKNMSNWIINKIIHLTGGKHRSWQTHSIDIVVVSSLIAYFLPEILFLRGKLTEVNKEVLSILLMGFMSGWISHILADMLTSAGVRLVCFMKFKIALVPKKIFNFRFNTGNEWEEFNYGVIKFINIFLGIFCLVYPAIPKGFITNVFKVAKQLIGGN